MARDNETPLASMDSIQERLQMGLYHDPPDEPDDMLDYESDVEFLVRLAEPLVRVDTDFPHQHQWTGADLKRWLSKTGFTQRQAAKVLGITDRQLTYMLSDHKGIVPRTALACMAILALLPLRGRKTLPEG